MDDRASRSHCIIIICVEINSAFRKQLKCQQKLNIYCSENLNNQLPQCGGCQNKVIIITEK